MCNERLKNNEYLKHKEIHNPTCKFIFDDLIYIILLDSCDLCKYFCDDRNDFIIHNYQCHSIIKNLNIKL